MRRVDSVEKTLMLGGIGGKRRRGRQRMRWLDGITDSMAWVWVNSGSLWQTGRPGVLQFMGSQRVSHDWATDLNWTEFLGCIFSLNCLLICVARSIMVNHKKYIYIHKINASSTHQFLPLFLNLSVYNYKMEIILSTSQYYSEDNTETRTLEPIHSPVSPVLTTRSDSTAFPFVKLQ